MALARTVRTLVYGLQPNDPVSLILASTLRPSVALGASLLPTRRATKVDPMLALRCE